MFKRTPLSHLLFALALALLAACNAPPTSPTPQPDPTPVVTQLAATDAPKDPTLAPDPSPNPEPASPAVGLVASSAASPTLINEATTALEQAAATHTWQLTSSAAGDPATALAEQLAANPVLLILIGADLTELTVATAQANPNLLLIAIDQSLNTDLPNVYVIGGPVNHLDEIGLVAGMFAGFATTTGNVGSLAPDNDLTGRTYQSSFLHGMRLACGECTHWPVALPDYASTSEGQAAIPRLTAAAVDALLIAPGPAGDAALTTAAEQGLLVTLAGRDLAAEQPDLAELTLPAAVPTVANALSAALDQFASTGDLPSDPTPYSFTHTTLRLTDLTTPAVTPGEYGYVQEIIAQLASGALQTGIDRSTGLPEAP